MPPLPTSESRESPTVYLFCRVCVCVCACVCPRVSSIKSYIIKHLSNRLTLVELQLLHQCELFQLVQTWVLLAWWNDMYEMIWIIVSPEWDCAETPHMTAPCPGGSSSRVSSCPAEKKETLKKNFFMQSVFISSLLDDCKQNQNLVGMEALHVWQRAWEALTSLL